MESEFKLDNVLGAVSMLRARLRQADAARGVTGLEPLMTPVVEAELDRVSSEASSWIEQQVSDRLAKLGDERVEVAVSGWRETARGHAINEDFYRGLLMKVAAYCGPEVFVSDDGSVQDSPLLLKVPELVAKLSVEATGVAQALARIEEKLVPAVVTLKVPEGSEMVQEQIREQLSKVVPTWPVGVSRSDEVMDRRDVVDVTPTWWRKSRGQAIARAISKVIASAQVVRAMATRVRLEVELAGFISPAEHGHLKAIVEACRTSDESVD